MGKDGVKEGLKGGLGPPGVSIYHYTVIIALVSERPIPR